MFESFQVRRSLAATTPIVAGLLLIAAGTGSAAQVQIEKQRPAAAGGEVHIENLFGSIRVIGWDRPDVAVSGTLAPGAEGMEFDGDSECVDVEIEVPESWLYGQGDAGEFGSDIEIRVPFATSLGIESINATIEIIDVRGSIELETVNGHVSVQGDPGEIEIATMTGNVEVIARGAAMAVETISGEVSLTGVAGEVAVETVSGAVTIEGTDLEYIEVSTTSGDITIDGTLRQEGEIELETFSGNVSLSLPSDVKAQFELTSFSGGIESSLGPTPSKEHRFSPYKQLRFNTGLDDFEVAIETHTGSIRLLTK